MRVEKIERELIMSDVAIRYLGALIFFAYTGELGYDGLNGTRKIGPSYAKICRTVVRHIQVHLY